jgi:hypothetical protein
MNIEMQQRFLYTPIFHIDTNLINARGKLETMNQIEKWAQNKLICVNMSGVSFKEAIAGRNITRKNKAHSQIFTLTDENISPNDALYLKIAAVLFPKGIKNDNERNDVKIIYEAAHYEAILITRDGGSRTQPGGILGNRANLRDIVQILSDFEAVVFIREKITKRDKFNQRVSQEFGLDLPEWTGKD